MKESNRTRAHQRYYLKSGQPVPGVTTITGELGWGKDALIKWGNNLGLKGIDSTKYKDEKADVGTLAHQMVMDYLQGIKADYTQEYSGITIDQAENCCLSFHEWEKMNRIEPALIETPLVSEVWKYGGQIDIYGNVNGELTLIDLKTGSGIYDEAIIQVSAYKPLLEEHGHKVERVRILNIPRTEDEAFTEKKVDCWDKGFLIFLHCLGIHNEKKGLKEK
jgi:hypothetical protein